MQEQLHLLQMQRLEKKLFNDDRLPYNISDFISKPATKKNIDIKNSFINICIENSFTMYMSFNIQSYIFFRGVL